MKTMKLTQMLVWIAGLALLVTACSPQAILGQASEQVQPTYTPYTTDLPKPTHTALVPSPTPLPTAGPEPTFGPIQPSGSSYSLDGVSFELDQVVAASVSGRIIPENPGVQDGPFWVVNPRYVEFALDGYALSETQQSPVIQVYPVEDYRRLSALADETLDTLASFLAEKPAAAEQIPLLPMINAVQIMRSNVAYVEFQNGSGVRFLTQYDQYPAPINNQEMFYAFQGLTSDGRYFVSAILPVNHPSLPMNADELSIPELEKIAMNANNYYGMISADLSAQSDGSFIPDLGKLDAMIASLVIEK